MVILFSLHCQVVVLKICVFNDGSLFSNALGSAIVCERQVNKAGQHNRNKDDYKPQWLWESVLFYYMLSHGLDFNAITLITTICLPQFVPKFIIH